MKLTPLLIGILLFTGAILAVGSIYGDLYTNYPYIENSTSEGNFTKFNESFTKIDTRMASLEQKVTGFKNKKGLAQYYDMLLAVADIGGILVLLPGLFTGFMSRTFTFMPYVPSWFILMLGIIITVIFVMRVVAIFTKTDEV